MKELLLGARRSGKTTRAIESLLVRDNTVLLVADDATRHVYRRMVRQWPEWRYLPESKLIDVERRIVTVDDFTRARSGRLNLPKNTALVVDETERVIEALTGLPVDLAIADITDTRVTMLPGGVRTPKGYTLATYDSGADKVGESSLDARPIAPEGRHRR